MISPEEQIDLRMLSILAFTAREGPLHSELEDFPVWKRAAVAVTPRQHRWRWSVYAPIISCLYDTL
jgi:hypothetical protein